MTTINQLSAVPSLNAGDQFPVFSSTQGDARKASMTTLAEFINNSAEAQSNIRADLASTAEGKGASLIGDDNGTNMQAAIDFARLRGLRLSTEFGDRGPGFDNFAVWQDIMAYLAGGTGLGVLCAPWHSEIVGELNRDTDTFEGVTLMGMPGQSAIRGDGAYGILRLGNIDGMTIDGMGFISDYVNATEDGGKSLLWNYERNTRQMRLQNCYFSNPASFTSAFTLYTNISTPVRTSSCNDVIIQGNFFENVGRLCSTIMNRNVDQSLCRGVHFIRNRVKRSGAAAPTYTTGVGSQLNGMFVSFDGTGEDHSTIQNFIEGAQGIGIEVVGTWRNGIHWGNQFKDFSNKFQQFSFQKGSFASGATYQTIQDNHPVGVVAGAIHANFYDMDSTSISKDNTYVSETTTQAALLRGTNGMRFIRDEFINSRTTGIYAVSLQLSSANNVFEDCLFSNAASTTNNATIRFEGTGTTGNRVYGKNTRILKGTGGLIYDQITSAVDNIVGPYRDATGALQGEYGSVAMADANLTLTGLDAMALRVGIRFTGTHTATRTLTFPTRLLVEGGVQVRNDTGQIIQFAVNGVNGETLASTARGRLVFDTALNSVRVI